LASCYCCCVVLSLFAFLEYFKSILAVEPSVCTHNSACTHELSWQLHRKALCSYYNAVVHETRANPKTSILCLFGISLALKKCPHRANDQKAWGDSRSRLTTCWLATACLLLPPPAVTPLLLLLLPPLILLLHQLSEWVQAQCLNAAVEGLRVKQCSMLLAYTTQLSPRGHTRQALLKVCPPPLPLLTTATPA